MRLYNTLLLQEPPFFRELDDGNVLIRDASSFPFVIEEVVSHGAVGVAIPGNSMSLAALHTLPPILASRVKVIDRNLRVWKMDRAIRDPICRDFGVMHVHDGASLTLKRPLERSVQDAVLDLEFQWYYFLLGIEHGLQIDVDAPRLRKAVTLLMKSSRDRESRAILATFAGILSVYKPRKIGAIKMVPNEPGELVDVFRALIEDQTYRAISKEFHNIGFPSRLRAAMSRIATLLQRLVRNRAFKNTMDLTTKTITAATQVPLPEADLGARLLGKKYLPPIVCLTPMLDVARKRWEESGCKFSKLNTRLTKW